VVGLGAMLFIMRTRDGKTVDVELQPGGRVAAGAGPGRLAIGFDIFRADFRKAVAEAHGTTVFGGHVFDLEAPAWGCVLKGCSIVASTMDGVTVAFRGSETR
jgi:hypothetical protein